MGRDTKNVMFNYFLKTSNANSSTGRPCHNEICHYYCVTSFRSLHIYLIPPTYLCLVEAHLIPRFQFSLLEKWFRFPRVHFERQQVSPARTDENNLMIRCFIGGFICCHRLERGCDADS